MVTADLPGIYCIFSPLLFFIIAVSFRLLDNSALLFLQKGIIVNSSYVPKKTIRRHIVSHPDKVFAKKLKRTLIYRKLHLFFIILMVSSAIPAVSCFISG